MPARGRFCGVGPVIGNNGFYGGGPSTDGASRGGASPSGGCEGSSPTPKRKAFIRFEDPRRNALEAAPFWLPQAWTQILPVTVGASACGGARIEFSVRELPCNVSVMRMPDGIEHVRLFEAGRAIQLLCRGESILGDPVFLNIPYAGLRESKQRLLMLERLIALDETGEFLPELFKPHPRARRIRVALQALDGDLAGARHREIAEAILGAEAVAAGWSGETRFAKSRFYRYLYYGRALMEGGYRALLR